MSAEQIGASTFRCPAGCGREFATANGAVMHAINSNEGHESITDKQTAYAALEDR
jgi:hypothetical protein